MIGERLPDDEADWLRSVQRAPMRDPVTAVQVLSNIPAAWATAALRWAAEHSSNRVAKRQAQRVLRERQP